MRIAAMNLNNPVSVSMNFAVDSGASRNLCVLFSLTPTLSLGERETSSAVSGEDSGWFMVPMRVKKTLWLLMSFRVGRVVLNAPRM